MAALGTGCATFADTFWLHTIPKFLTDRRSFAYAGLVTYASRSFLAYTQDAVLSNSLYNVVRGVCKALSFSFFCSKEKAVHQDRKLVLAFALA